MAKKRSAKERLAEERAAKKRSAKERLAEVGKWTWTLVSKRWRAGVMDMGAGMLLIGSLGWKREWAQMTMFIKGLKLGATFNATGYAIAGSFTFTGL